MNYRSTIGGADVVEDFERAGLKVEFNFYVGSGKRRYDADFRQDPLPAAKRYFSEYLDHPHTITTIEEVSVESDEAVWYDVWLQREK